MIRSAHDCSEGGLGVAAAESCITGPGKPVGAVLNLQSTLRKDALLFGESQSRILISFPEKSRESIATAAQKKGVDFMAIGKTGGNHFTVNINDEEFVHQDIHELQRIWKNRIGDYARQTA